MNKLGLAIGGVGIIAVIAIVLSVTLVTDINRGDASGTSRIIAADGDPITFDEFISSKFRAPSFNGTWWSGNEIQWQDEESNLVLFNVETNETSTLVAADTVGVVSNSATFMSFAPSDSSLLLFADKRESVWRHSFLAEYIVLDSKTNNTVNIVPKTADVGTKLQYAQWVPSTASLVYVFNNNIYIRTVLDDPSTDVQLTDDGVKDTVYNGIPDWVYEEEILATNKAMYFTKSGSKIAFAKFNDTMVDEFYYTKYGDPKDPFEAQYPEQIMLKYPKSGRPNPTVQLMVSPLDGLQNGDKTKPLYPPSDIPTSHMYTTATWVNDERLAVVWVNRVQNESSFTECTEQETSWECITLSRQDQQNGWVDIFQPPVYKTDGSAYVQIVPREVGDLTYPHVKLFQLSRDFTEITEELFITDETEKVVTSILGWDEKEEVVYFIATEPNFPGTRQLYKASSQSDSLQDTCMTCDLKTQRGQDCKYNSIRMSKDHKYYVQSCNGPNLPEIVLRNSNNDLKFIFELNEELEEKLQGKAISERIDLTVEVEGGYKAPVVLRAPNGYNPNEKLPLLVYVYGGPGSQTVSQRWSVDWADYLTSNYGIVYASIDGRGTGFQSNEFMFKVFHALGTVEMADQISVTKELLDTYQFLDASRTAIWGWSYGGYATAMTLIQDEDDVFKCGLSVAPPTDWLLYDSMYTERFMGLPTPLDNLAGYNKSSLLDKVESLRGKPFQLNHGVADDNVHFQQSMLLMRALEKGDIPFEQNSYPDENHGLGGVRRAVYHNFDSFWLKCFGFESVYTGAET